MKLVARSVRAASRAARRWLTPFEESPPFAGRSATAWEIFRSLESRAHRGELIVLDGATGTELTKHPRGVTGEEQWNGFPAQLFVPEVVTDVHQSYVDAGSEIVTCNTYGSNRHVMGVGVASEHTSAIEEANEVAVQLAAKPSTEQMPSWPEVCPTTHLLSQQLTKGKARLRDQVRQQIFFLL